MKIAFLITMFNEYGIVRRNIELINSYFQESDIYIAHSNDNTENEDLSYIKKHNKCYISFPNLASILKSKPRIPSYSLSRNFSSLFYHLYNFEQKKYDYIVALCGDSLINDPIQILSKIEEIKNKNCFAYVLKPNTNVDFHSSYCDLDNENGTGGGRIETINCTDFFPQFFILNYDFCRKNKAFSNIKITNPYTSEQCLGDELLKHFEDVQDFHSKVLKIHNHDVHQAGVVLHRS